MLRHMLLEAAPGRAVFVRCLFRTPHLHVCVAWQFRHPAVSRFAAVKKKREGPDRTRDRSVLPT